MLPLPLLNVRLHACSEDWAQMTPTAQGRHCAACARPVLDFTQAHQSDLEAAFQAAPDGRVCGRFRPDQLAADQPAPLPARPALRPKLRRFLVALLLVCGLGLGAREAMAQVRQAARAVPAQAQTFPDPASRPYGAVAEQMPDYKDGGNEGLMRFIAKNLRYPPGFAEGGRVFVKFTVTKEGKVQNPEIMKGLGAGPDAEALRVVRLLGPWTPGYQNGRPVDVYYAIPITFSAK